MNWYLFWQFVGIGLLIASLMKSTESFGFIMQLLVFPMFFLSGAFFLIINAGLVVIVVCRLLRIPSAASIEVSILAGLLAGRADVYFANATTVLPFLNGETHGASGAEEGQRAA